MQVWDAQFATRSPMFAPLRSFAGALEGAAWPSPERLNALANRTAILSGGGQPLRFASPSRHPAPAMADYELCIHDNGVALLREANWHDLFNALVWLAFPRTKAALNRSHAGAIREQGTRTRNARRDALTLFDESGILVLSCSRAVLERLRAFEWRRVFWDEQEALLRTTRFVIFGHALYEKALSPYVGMSGHALLLDTPAAFDLSDEPALLAYADAVSAAAVPERLVHPRDLSPLPVLGVPGWWDANREAAFYANTDYFRRGRTRQGAQGAQGAQDVRADTTG